MEKLIRLRLDAGLSQRQLAQRAGVSNTTVWHMERGHYKGSPGTLKKVAEVLGVKPSELVRL